MCQRILVWELLTLRIFGGSESTVDAVHPAVVDSACAGLELDAGSGHMVRSSCVCSVGDTRQSFSEQ